MKLKILIVSLLFLPSVISAQNPTLETIFQRKSVRSYTERPVSLDTLTILVKAGMAAPTGMNKQPWDFVVVYGKEAMSKLAEKMPGNRMLKEAQAAIAVVGNPDVSKFWYEDCSAATQNILLAAESMGLGAVWTAGYPIEERMNQIAEALSIPLPYRPLCLIPIGYPKGPQSPKDKWKESKMHINGW